MSTDNGISFFDPNRKIFKNFYASDGLQSDQFYWSAGFENKDGKLHFGSMNGLNSFMPEDINGFKSTPNILISDLKIFNESVKVDKDYYGNVILDKSIVLTKEIVLSYKLREFSIEFTALDYDQPEKIQYSYKMEGFDNQWMEVNSNRRFASYTNLPGKRYTFLVRARNNEGIWNTEPARLKIQILPPFWKTWWFILIAIIIIAVILLSIYRIRVYNINQQRQKLKESVKQRTTELSEANSLLEEKQEEIMMQNEELNRHRNNLEELVSERTVELDSARKKAEEADRLKSAFLANMSHEIRTPMNAIVGFSNLLLTEHDDKEKDEYIRIINNNCENLMVLINDILDISLIEANQLKIDPLPFDANLVLKELESIYNLKKKPGISIILDIPIQKQLILVTDQFRFRQILNNLLSNAIKYTDEGQIKFGYRLENNHVIFYVADSGIGIEKNDFMRVFDYFQKLDNDKTKLYKGTGIGLSICKKLVELLGGEIWLESEAGKGSTFSFKLPISVESYTAASIKKRQVLNTDVKMPEVKIIIAEDEATNYILLEKILKPLEVKIIWTKNGKELVDFIKSSSDLKKSLIIMDIKMPVMNGVDAFHEIRKLNKSIPIIAVTAYATENERKEILQHGFTDYISKPVNVQGLLDAIKNAISLN